MWMTGIKNYTLLEEYRWQFQKLKMRYMSCRPLKIFLNLQIFVIFFIVVNELEAIVFYQCSFFFFTPRSRRDFTLGQGSNCPQTWALPPMFPSPQPYALLKPGVIQGWGRRLKCRHCNLFALPPPQIFSSGTVPATLGDHQMERNRTSPHVRKVNVQNFSPKRGRFTTSRFTARIYSEWNVL